MKRVARTAELWDLERLLLGPPRLPNFPSSGSQAQALSSTIEVKEKRGDCVGDSMASVALTRCTQYKTDRAYPLSMTRAATSSVERVKTLACASCTRSNRAV